MTNLNPKTPRPRARKASQTQSPQSVQPQADPSCPQLSFEQPNPTSSTPSTSSSAIPQDAQPPSPNHQGHRSRLRHRLFTSGPESFQDYELLELLLCAALPRKDVKPLAKKLLSEYNDLWSLLNASPQNLRASKLSDSVIAALLVTGAVALRAHKISILQKPVLNSWPSIIDYCRAAMAHEQKEQFRLLFLNRKNRLMAEEVHQRGTIDHTPAYPREVVKRALDIGAGAIILAHNHPSGDTMPSKADIEITRAIINACAPLGITVHDHIIIGRETVTSFKALGLIA